MPISKPYYCFERDVRVHSFSESARRQVDSDTELHSFLIGVWCIIFKKVFRNQAYVVVKLND